MSDIYAKQDPMPQLSVEERLTVLEILLDTLLFWTFDQHPLMKRDLAEGLRTTAQVSAAHQSLPENVLRALTAYADRFEQIDHYADWLKDTLRPDPNRPDVADDSSGDCSAE